ncbi:hypothetical protein [Aeromonas veronii]|uniref:hypothetical protein n=1 Tax=Aeromonas veronii TaxID=654 RepID=UPI003B9E9AE8
MSKISERVRHVKIRDGYCLICGEFGTLSIDHVPPQGSITVTKVEQRHIMEMMGAEARSIRGVSSTNGSKFRTICSNCNSNILGGNDGEIADVHRKLTNKIRNYFQNPTSPYNTVSVDIAPIKYARAMIGHILSATSVTECKVPPQESSYFDPLKRFVLGDDHAISETHDIHYWFYPYDRHLSAKCVGFLNQGHSTVLSLLSFFPIAFLVTPKNEGIYPTHAARLDLTSNKLVLDLSSYNIHFSDFPFSELRESQMCLLTDYQTIVSYPVK